MKLNKWDGKIFNVKNVKKNPIAYYREIKKVLEENNYQIVHINLLSFANILPILAAKSAKVPNIIVHSHNGGVPTGKLRKILNTFNQNIILRNKGLIFWACSQLAGKWMFNNNTFKVINNAIDIEKFKFNISKRNELREKLGIKDSLVIGHVGRFQEQKNHEFLIDIFSEIHKKNEDAILLLIGVGELKEKIEYKVKNLNLENNVKMLGKIENVSDYYQAMDIFLLPSLFEGFPVVAVEAQSSGLLCIMSENITREAKILPTTKFISLYEKPYKWAEKILCLYENYNREKSSNCDEIKEYDIKGNSKELQRLYIDLKKGVN